MQIITKQGFSQSEIYFSRFCDVLLKILPAKGAPKEAESLNEPINSTSIAVIVRI